MAPDQLFLKPSGSGSAIPEAPVAPTSVFSKFFEGTGPPGARSTRSAMSKFIYRYVRNPGPGALGSWRAPGGRGPGIRGPGPGILGSRVWIPDSGVWGLDSRVSEGLRAWKSCAVGGFSPPLSVNCGSTVAPPVARSSRAGSSWDSCVDSSPGSRPRSSPGSSWDSSTDTSAVHQ